MARPRKDTRIDDHDWLIVEMAAELLDLEPRTFMRAATVGAAFAVLSDDGGASEHSPAPGLPPRRAAPASAAGRTPPPKAES